MEYAVCGETIISEVKQPLQYQKEKTTIELLDIGIDNAVAFKIDGKITENDMEKALGKLKEKIDAHADVVIYQQVESLGGVELDAIFDKVKFLFETGISDIKKVAVVTDKKWMQKVVQFDDMLFRKIDMRAFSTEDKEAAIAFLKP